MRAYRGAAPRRRQDVTPKIKPSDPQPEVRMPAYEIPLSPCKEPPFRFCPVKDTAGKIVLYDIFRGKEWFGSRRLKPQAIKYVRSLTVIEVSCG
jgi:hypothetical protein